MSLSLFVLQIVNGVEYGLLLFLVASGLTLVFGVLGVLNFAHGSFYMLGAYLAWWLSERTGSLLLAILLAIPAMVLIGLAVERLAIARLYLRDHLSQVLLTYGLVLLFNELQRALWGNDVHGVRTPAALAWTMPLGETQTWPAWRALTTLACVCIGVAMRQIVLKTRFGMRVRAGASNAEMVEALGIDVRRLFAIVVVIGGIGSIKGAFFGALLVGLADTFGKVLLPGFASAIVYAVMAAVLLWRPRGLLGPAFEGR